MNPQKYLLSTKVRRTMTHLKAPPLLVLLHGEGGDDEEVFDLFQKADDRFVLVSLKAPFLHEGKKYLWYSTTRVKDEFLANPAQIEYSRQQIISAIHQIVIRYQCNRDQVYIFGFGQGGVMALNILLSVPGMIAGIAVLNSQFLPEFRAQLPDKEALRSKAIFICHGKYNQIIPIELGRKLKYELSTIPTTIEYQEFEVGHYYSIESISAINNWLSLHLNEANVSEPQVPIDYSIKLVAYQIYVRDIDRSINFYTRFLGMRLVERTGKAFAFLSNNQAHHVIELQLLDNDEPGTVDVSSPGYHSIQFEVPDQISFAKAFLNLLEAGENVTASDRTICWLMKFADPDGNLIEIIWDTRHLPGRSNLWHGRELPLEKETILEILVNS